VNGAPKPGYSSGDAISVMERLATSELPPAMSIEWTELALQEILAGNTAVFVFALGALLVFMVLAAQYESWSLPLAIILIVPMCLLAAISGVWLVGSDNNIFTQVGLVVLIGLAAKNAILIVEFSKQLQDQGNSRFDAVVEACRVRLRPILMTSAAFILGVVPLLRGAGAGAEMRFALGIAVFSGMLGVTIFGVFFTPVFYEVIRGYTDRRADAKKAAAPPPSH
jgi:multidrug efflux pump